MRLVSTSAALLNCCLERVSMSPRGRTRQAFACRGNVQKHGRGFRVRFWCGEIQNMRESKKKALADFQCLRQCSTSGDLVACAASLKAPASPPCSSQSLTLCGLNVQYPWSRLLMVQGDGCEYALGKYRCFSAGEQLFFIETLGSGSTQGAMVDIAMVRAPLKAQVLGVIVLRAASSLRITTTSMLIDRIP